MSQAKTILLIDDDAVVRDMYRERIKAEGYELIEAKDGDEGLEMAKKVQPDLILLDIMMPKINGLDVLGQLKRETETKKIPVIILTALVSEVEKVKQITTDFVDYVVKADTTPGNVVDKINAQLGVIK